MTTTLVRLEGREDTRAGGVLTGTGTLLRFMLRRDRVRLPAWILGTAAVTTLMVRSHDARFADLADRETRAALMENPGTRAMTGPGYGLDDYTVGAMISNELLLLFVLLAALMSIFTVVRHTRGEEETGRAELVRSSRVGRHATTTAALTVACGASLALGATVALALGALGLEGVDGSSALLFGAALASIGVVFASIAAVTVQCTEHARGASGLAGAVFALAFLLRAMGDVSEQGGSALSWLSPIGWAHQTRVFVDDRWWPLLLSSTLAVVLGTTAYWLSTRRDVGASLVRPRPGPATASTTLSSPLGLAWRLQRSGLAWWGTAIGLFALGYGTLANEIADSVAEMSAVQDLAAAGRGVIDAWLSLIIGFFAVIVAVAAVLSAVRARSEELSGRAEPILATTVSRSRWLGSHLVVALATSAALMILVGVGLGLSVSATLGDGDLLWRLAGAAVAHVPAVWMTVAMAVAVIGLVPRATPAVWVVLAYAGIGGPLGTLLEFPQWAINLSPLSHTPRLPNAEMQWLPLLVATAVAGVLIAVGLAGLRRRDLQTTA